MRSRITTFLVAGVLIGLALLLLVMPLPRHWYGGGWRGKVCDLAHVPLFALLTLGLAVLCRGAWYLPAGISVALAALAEVVQHWTGRSGNVRDFLRGAVGVAIAVVVVHAWMGPRDRWRFAAHALIIAALLVWPVLDCGPSLLDAYEGYQALPLLADFDTPRQMLRWECNQSRLRRVPDPDEPGRWIGRLTFRPGPLEHPSAVLHPVTPDWSGHCRVCCEFTVHEGPLRIVISIREGRNEKGDSSHFQFEKLYAPGRHVAYAELAMASRKSHFGSLDLTNMLSVQFFTYRRDLDRDRTIDVHRVWLE
jgi:hypothetical protein